MHTLAALPVALLNLLFFNSLPTVGAISDRSVCVRQNAALLAEAATCGDIRSLQKCFSDVPNFVTMDDLQRCFIDADCTIAEAASEAAIILEGCDESSPAPELRRRDPETMPAATPNPTPQNKTPESTSPARTTSTTLTRPTVCSTARMIKTTVCPITSLGKDDFSKLPCTSTTLTTMECAATNVCWDNGDCIFRDNNLQVSGLIVTIVLSLVVVGAVATLLYFYALDRKARRLAREKLEEKKRALMLKLDQEASEAKAREYAKYQMKRERLRRQQMEAQDWARRRAMEDQRPANPFGDGAAAAADTA
ncbi:hypothetical protein FHL15_000434 [Xylaria flabelliformis]|uniref:Extracellular membrane protein CFEM domain-containing protein n=1 Tax=Xylaria flabelliformis TaxID=2512241 RepID=A0A553IFW6_9PEZI|nr:hypothetical protein FHL15_000434 [Xylaria flabelliformis]